MDGTIGEGTLRAADTPCGDPIAMGARRRAVADGRLGPKAARLVRPATQSVHLVRA